MVQSIFNFGCASFGYQEKKVCDGLSDLFGEEFIYIVTHSTLNRFEICGLILSPNCFGEIKDYPSGEKWTLPLKPLNTSHLQALASLSKCLHEPNWI